MLRKALLLFLRFWAFIFSIIGILFILPGLIQIFIIDKMLKEEFEEDELDVKGEDKCER